MRKELKRRWYAIFLKRRVHKSNTEYGKNRKISNDKGTDKDIKKIYACFAEEFQKKEIKGVLRERN